MNSVDLLTVISRHTEELFAQLPAVRGGQVEGVHDARVACRRLRELLPLMGDDRRAAQAGKVLVEAGRHLGRVRDLDVMSAVLTEHESILPAAALAVASARRTVTRQLREERRTLIKTLEALELGRVALFRHPAHAGWRPRHLPFVRAQPSWIPMLRDRVSLRAQRLRSAVDHATGVYFPKRMHGARRAVKKLRYVVEAAADLGMWNPPHLLGDLKKVQAGLGTLHDAQVLIDAMPRLVEDIVPREETAALLSALDADIIRRHQAYLGKRERLLAAANACDRFATGSAHVANHGMSYRPMVAASVSAVAIPATFMLLHRRAG